MLAILIFFSSCNTTKFLKEDEVLLKEINIVFTGEGVDDGSALRSELEKFYRIKPNKSFLFTSRAWYYFRNQSPSDTSWYKRWVKKAIAEKPAYLDTNVMISSAADMQKYLRNKKGYYNAEVNYDIEFQEKTAAAIYFVNPRRRYIINSLSYDIKDSLLIPFIDTITQKSILKKGDPLDAFSFELEKQRMLEELQNRGFADFNLSYIDIKGDSTDLDHAVDIFIEILNPPNKDHHQQYYLGEIHVYTDFNQSQKKENTEVEFYQNKFFHRENDKFIVRKKAINDHIYFETNERYSRENHYKTIQELTELESYKFSKLSPKISLKNDTIIDYEIQLTPHKNRWILDLGNNIFYSTLTGQQLFGFALSAGLQNRNMFGGAEKYSITTETGIEFNTPSINPTDWTINTLSLGLQNNLEIPKLLDVLGSFGLMNRIGTLSNRDYSDVIQNTKTSIGLSYSRQNILNLYNIESINSSWTYNYQPNLNNRVSFTQIGLDLNRYQIYNDFELILDDNPLISLSFVDVLFTGFLFKDLSYFYQSKLSRKKSYWAILAGLETSGVEFFLGNKLYGLFGNGPGINTIGGIDLANFVKLDFDTRWYKQLNAKSTFATRLSLGIATPYSDDQTVSYVKQLYVGGPSSIRAWQSRELGAGSYKIPAIRPPQKLPSNQFYQTGDIKIEFSTEYRFDLFWVLEGALFLDGGNVWTLRSDPERIGTVISEDFLDQIALGTGWGLRWDFSYFIIRFDFGYKIRYPYVYENNSHWRSPLEQGVVGNVNVAVNYPF